MSNRRRNRRGSILIQLLITVGIVSLYFPLMLNMLKILSGFDRFPTAVQDQIGLLQLRRFLSSCRITEITSSELVCQNEKIWTLRSSGRNLYLSEGTLIVLEGVSEVYFDVRNQEVWMIYLRDESWKEVLIAYV